MVKYNGMVYTLLLIVSVGSFTLCIDFFSKYYIANFLDFSVENRFQILPFFDLVHVRNFGISFGLFQEYHLANKFFTIFNIVIVVVLFLYALGCTSIWRVIAVSLICGGASGNILDRVLYGFVVDFLDFHLFNFHFPAFNIADSAIFIGVLLVLFLPDKNEKI